MLLINVMQNINEELCYVFIKAPYELFQTLSLVYNGFPHRNRLIPTSPMKSTSFIQRMPLIIALLYKYRT